MDNEGWNKHWKWKEANDPVGKTQREGATYGNIQWKGTDVCIDIECECGHSEHFDGYFLYYWECEKCKKVYALSSAIHFIKLDEWNTEFVKKDGRLETSQRNRQHIP